MNALFPRHCVFCSLPSQRDYHVCHHCETLLPELKTACKCCGLSLPSNQSGLICGQCLKTPPHFDRTYALFPYQLPLSHLIKQMKFHHTLLYAELFGELICTQLNGWYDKEPLPQAILPVPLHQQRLRQRGYNQAIEIAKPIKHHCKLPLLKTICHRHRATQAQSDLKMNQRKQNIAGAFQTLAPLHYQHLAIIDDVMTTGHTVNELARVLKSAGVARVDVWCVARIQ